MQVQRVQNNNTSFRALKGFECSKNLKPRLGDLGDAIEQKLFKAFHEKEFFQKFCRENDVWVNITPINTPYIRSGLDVEIYAAKINEKDEKLRKNVTKYVAAEFYGKQFYPLLDVSYRGHANDVTQIFIQNPDGLELEIKRFIEKSSKMKNMQ